MAWPPLGVYHTYRKGRTNPTDRLLIITAAYTGMRWGELVGQVGTNHPKAAHTWVTTFATC